MSLTKSLILSLTLIYIVLTSGQAQTWVGGEITWKNTGNDSFFVSVHLYSDCSEPIYSSIQVNFRCKSNSGLILKKTFFLQSSKDITPVCASQCTKCSSGCGFGYGFKEYIYSELAVLSSSGSCCEIKIEYNSASRPSSLTNVVTPSSFHVESVLNRCQANPVNSPEFLSPPVVIACVNQDLTLPFAVLDQDVSNTFTRDSVGIQLINPVDSLNNSLSFTGSFTYDKPVSFWGFPNAGMTSPRGYHLSANGLLNFRSMKAEESLIAIKVNEYRNGMLTSHVTRDVLIKTISCPANFSPVISSPTYKEVCPGDTAVFSITTSDPNSGDSVFLYLVNTSPNVVFNATNGTVQKATGSFRFIPKIEDAGKEINFLLKASDNACSFPGNTFKVVTVKVLPVAKVNVLVADSGCGRLHFSAVNILGNYKSILWHGLPGNDSTGEKISVNFMNKGLFPFSVETITDKGCVTRYSDQVNVNITLPYVDAGMDDTVCFHSDTIHLSGNHGTGTFFWSGKGVLYSNPNWFFDPGESSILPNEKINLILNVSDDKGCSNSDTIQILVLKTTDPVLKKMKPVCESASIFQLTASPEGGKWIGKGVYIDKFDPKTAGSGLHELIYTVTTNGICPSSDTAVVLVNPVPEIGFYSKFYSGTIPLQIEFYDTSKISSGKIKNYIWNFGDGGTDTARTGVQHTYLQKGDYSVVLILTTDSGCSDYLIKTNLISAWNTGIEYASNEVIILNSDEVVEIKNAQNIISVSVFSVDGKMTDFYNVYGSCQLFIQKHELNKGINLLRIVTKDGKIANFKIIID